MTYKLSYFLLLKLTKPYNLRIFLTSLIRSPRPLSYKDEMHQFLDRDKIDVSFSDARLSAESIIFGIDFGDRSSSRYSNHSHQQLINYS